MNSPEIIFILNSSFVMSQRVLLFLASNMPCLFLFLFDCVAGSKQDAIQLFFLRPSEVFFYNFLLK